MYEEKEVNNAVLAHVGRFHALSTRTHCNTRQPYCWPDAKRMNQTSVQAATVPYTRQLHVISVQLHDAFSRAMFGRQVRLVSLFRFGNEKTTLRTARGCGIRH